MTRAARVRRSLPAAVLALLAATALFAPWLGLRDPALQPDSRVLGALPPGGSAWRVVLRDGEERWGEAARRASDGSVTLVRAGTSRTIPTERVARVAHERFWLGTDELGRDLLSRLIHGGRVSLAVGLLAAAFALAAGALVGLVAGLAGGLVDAVLMRFTDLVLSVPRLFLALLLVALYGASTVTTVLVLGATTWMAAARLVRAEILSARDREFVQAARASGLSSWRLGWFHLLPAAAPPLVVESVLRVGDTILLESTLSFLGLGVQPPRPSWGNLIADGKDRLLDAWWIATLPGLAVAATVLALYLLGDRALHRDPSDA